jgi:hypothetical protein
MTPFMQPVAYVGQAQAMSRLAVVLLRRQSAGVVPVHRLNARTNALVLL